MQPVSRTALCGSCGDAALLAGLEGAGALAATRPPAVGPTIVHFATYAYVDLGSGVLSHLSS